MESEKRKQRDNDELVDGKRKKTRAEEEEEGAGKTEDDEVEEFFAILRRIRAAVKYFEKGKRKGDGDQKASRTWSPSFQQQDFHKASCDREGVEENVGLDLNADPVLDPDFI
ncbi:hypothetical protein LguiA_000564 [Lonicera macranthoides]